jgi:hypothetical protein
LAWVELKSRVVYRSLVESDTRVIYPDLNSAFHVERHGA